MGRIHLEDSEDAARDLKEDEVAFSSETITEIGLGTRHKAECRSAVLEIRLDIEEYGMVEKLQKPCI